MVDHAGEIILYRGDDGGSVVQLRAVDGTIWLAQLEIAELYGTSLQNIQQVIARVLADGEVGEATINSELIVRTEGVPHSDVIAYRCQDYDNEYWSVRWDAGAGAYQLVNNVSHQCLNQDWSGGVQHSAVIAYTCHAASTSTNERWVFVRKG